MFKLTVVFVFIACFVLSAEAYRLSGLHDRSPNPRYRDPVQEYLQTRSCIPLGGTGCESNHGKCCREGDPYTGIMRKCRNKGSPPSPVYTCVKE